jgi:carotenoid 1,2-hydratase
LSFGPSPELLRDDAWWIRMRLAHGFPDFDRPVPTGGYAWWYVDAQSDDGRHGLTIIAFVGSVFSPYYARSLRSGRGDPLDHCALNVALYGNAGKRWVMTERGRAVVARSATTFTVGPSALAWDRATLTIEVDEVTVPWPSSLRGIVRLTPSAFTGATFPLDADALHHWRPLAPCARVAVDLRSPSLRWQGNGYLDSNDGAAPLAEAFRGWHWSRACRGDRTTVLYDIARRDGTALRIARHFDASGRSHAFEPPPAAALAPTRWKVARTTPCDAGILPRASATLEDAPFYARSLVETTIGGQPMLAMHESLALDRFRARWVRSLLPFRMPRRRR